MASLVRISAVFLLLAFINTIAVTAVPESEHYSLIEALRFRGYHLFANAITTTDIHYDIINSGNLTFFAPIDSALYNLDMIMSPAKYTKTLRFHCIPDHRLSLSDLQLLPYGSNSFSSLISGHEIHIDNPSPLPLPITVEGVEIAFPDLYYDEHIVVHGLEGVMDVRSVIDSSNLTSSSTFDHAPPISVLSEAHAPLTTLYRDEHAPLVSVYSEAHSPSMTVYREEHAPSISVYSEAHSPSMTDYREKHAPSISVHSEAHSPSMTVYREEHAPSMSSHSEAHSPSMTVYREEHAPSIPFHSEAHGASMIVRSIEQAPSSQVENSIAVTPSRSTIVSGIEIDASPVPSSGLSPSYHQPETKSASIIMQPKEQGTYFQSSIQPREEHISTDMIKPDFNFQKIHDVSLSSKFTDNDANEFTQVNAKMMDCPVTENGDEQMRIANIRRGDVYMRELYNNPIDMTCVHE